MQSGRRSLFQPCSGSRVRGDERVPPDTNGSKLQVRGIIRLSYEVKTNRGEVFAHMIWRFALQLLVEEVGIVSCQLVTVLLRGLKIVVLEKTITPAAKSNGSLNSIWHVLCLGEVQLVLPIYST